MQIKNHGPFKYDGPNPCPSRKGQAVWESINDDRRLYRVTCPNCPTIERTLQELANQLELKLD